MTKSFIVDIEYLNEDGHEVRVCNSETIGWKWVIKNIQNYMKILQSVTEEKKRKAHLDSLPDSVPDNVKYCQVHTKEWREKVRAAISSAKKNLCRKTFFDVIREFNDLEDPYVSFTVYQVTRLSKVEDLAFDGIDWSKPSDIQRLQINPLCKKYSMKFFASNKKTPWKFVLIYGEVIGVNSVERVKDFMSPKDAENFMFLSQSLGEKWNGKLTSDCVKDYSPKLPILS